MSESQTTALPPDKTTLTQREQDQGWAIREHTDENGVKFAILYQAMADANNPKKNANVGAYMAHLPPGVRELSGLENILHDHCEELTMQAKADLR
jgi:hypothetical protein